jgi:hypothetical protein
MFGDQTLVIADVNVHKLLYMVIPGQFPYKAIHVLYQSKTNWFIRHSLLARYIISLKFCKMPTAIEPLASHPTLQSSLTSDPLIILQWLFVSPTCLVVQPAPQQLPDLDDSEAPDAPVPTFTASSPTNEYTQPLRQNTSMASNRVVSQQLPNPSFARSPDLPRAK